VSEEAKTDDERQVTALVKGGESENEEQNGESLKVGNEGGKGESLNRAANEEVSGER
jgi:hypothetical protein